MEVIFHIGLYKTGTTFIQHLCDKNRENLAQQGVHYPYEPNPDTPAHYNIAWKILEGDFSGLEIAINEARALGLNRLLISAEDLSALIFRLDITQSLSDFISSLDSATCRYVVFIRRQGPLFWSLYSELSNQMYADHLVLFYEVMKRGYFMSENPTPGAIGPKFWYFCFNHKWYINMLCQITGFDQLDVCDFDQFGAYPGAEMFRKLGLDDANFEMPIRTQQNASYNETEIQGNYRQRFRQILSDPDSVGLQQALDCRTIIDETVRQEISEALDQRYFIGNHHLWTKFNDKQRPH